MDLDTWQRLRNRYSASISSTTAGKLVAAFVILVVPGGLMLPLCYAAYAALTQSAARKPDAASGARTEPRASAASRLMRCVSRTTTSTGANAR
jgi:hypothetical protein